MAPKKQKMKIDHQGFTAKEYVEAIATDDMSAEERDYERRLFPYLVEGYKLIHGSPGLPARLKQYTEVYDWAETKLLECEGIYRLAERRHDFMRFLVHYEAGHLPLRMKA